MIILGFNIKWVGFRKERIRKEVLRVYKEENFILAVKRYRELTGAELKKAKEVVESITGHRLSTR